MPDVVTVGLGAEDPFVTKWDPYVTVVARKFVLSVPADVQAADPAGYAQAAALVASSNANGGAISGTGGNSTGIRILGSGSHGDYGTAWWGASVYLDEYATNRAAVFLAGAGTLGNFALLIGGWTGAPAGIAKGIATALQTLAFALKGCDANGRGVGIRAEWLTVIPLTWCWAR